MQQLADSQNNSLHTITIYGEEEWFESGESLVLLVSVIARQTELKFLRASKNCFNEEKEQQVRNSVANPDCRIIVTDEEEDAYEKE